MKKFLALVLTIVLAFCCCAVMGCGNSYADMSKSEVAEILKKGGPISEFKYYISTGGIKGKTKIQLLGDGGINSIVVSKMKAKARTDNDYACVLREKTDGVKAVAKYNNGTVSSGALKNGMIYDEVVEMPFNDFIAECLASGVLVTTSVYAAVEMYGKEGASFQVGYSVNEKRIKMTFDNCSDGDSEIDGEIFMVFDNTSILKKIKLNISVSSSGLTAKVKGTLKCFDGIIVML